MYVILNADNLSNMAIKVTKAVIPAAGLGTRFLPATKAMPKEMLPVVDKPAIQYVVEEAVDAGLHDVLLVTGRNKNALENHFDRATELEATPAEEGRHAIACRRSCIRPTSPTCTMCARATRRVSATRCCAPRCTSGTSRSPYSSATTSSTAATCC